MDGQQAAAGLRYVSDRGAGIRRLRTAAGFDYFDAAGERVRDPETLERIRRLAIPPAWETVWIAPEASAHLQATGRDAAGRKQYRYHPLWSQARSATKFDNLLAFARQLPALRRRIARDRKGQPLERRYMVAAAVRLLEATRIRVGNREYTSRSGTRGLTTLTHGHLEIEGACIELHYTGKGGKEQRVRACDESLAGLMRVCQELPGQELFRYRGERGELVAVDSADVNRYIQEATGGPFTAKDFRTWAGTVEALAVLSRFAAAGRSDRHALNEAVVEVAGRLGNTRAVCRKYYIHPLVIALFEAGELGRSIAAAAAVPTPAGLRREERLAFAVLAGAAGRAQPDERRRRSD